MRTIELGDMDDRQPKTKRPAKTNPSKSSKTSSKQTTKPKPKSIKKTIKKSAESETLKPKKLKIKKSVKTEDSKPKKLKIKSKKDGTKSNKTSLAVLKQNRKNLEAEGQQLLEKLDNSVFDKNREFLVTYENMFTSLITMCEISENKYIKSESSREIYALMKLYDQLREVIADMKSLQDIGDYVNAINSEVIHPLLMTSAQTLIEFTKSVCAFALKNISADEAKQLELYTKTQAKIAGQKLNDAYTVALDNTQQVLAG